jgi:hypothetical protein
MTPRIPERFSSRPAMANVTPPRDPNDDDDKNDDENEDEDGDEAEDEEPAVIREPAQSSPLGRDPRTTGTEISRRIATATPSQTKTKGTVAAIGSGSV